MPTYNAKLILTDIAGNTEKTLTGELSDAESPPTPNPGGIDFTANWQALPAGTTIMTGGEWNDIFAAALAQHVDVYCLEQNSDATRHDFSIIDDGRGGQCLRMFMPKGSYGMGHRSTNLTLGPVNGAVNVEYEFLVEPGWSGMAGGGKYPAATQYGPIQSGPTGGIRLMPTWASGASVLGKQDLSFSIQSQPDGAQFLQPPYYGVRPVEIDHWYKIRTRMRGGVIDAPGNVLCEFWKDDDPPFSYEATTDNPNVLQGKASVSIEITGFFGGTAPNAAPADTWFRVGKFRVWVE